MKKQSIWNAYSRKEEFKSLKENIETDVLIVGGGIVGILCAYELKQRNINCIIVEKNKIGQGNLFVIRASLAKSAFSTTINDGFKTA